MEYKIELFLFGRDCLLGTALASALCSLPGFSLLECIAVLFSFQMLAWNTLGFFFALNKIHLLNDVIDCFTTWAQVAISLS